MGLGPEPKRSFSYEIIGQFQCTQERPQRTDCIDAPHFLAQQGDTNGQFLQWLRLICSSNIWWERHCLPPRLIAK